MTVTHEEVKVRGTELADKVKSVIHEGNVRRIIVKDSHGHTVMEIPVTVGVVAFIAAPALTAVAALAAAAAEWSIRIERDIQGEQDGGLPAA
ncbi:DUF4342 domain-containing protein [Nonomuraea basaltis]|uniref:DUF4342 domain-containing protein n=1 Tax=Nonomuraea basaltis TaxID=2495887 RepID=UPI00110C4701|nr:DUF4342 domain-containing protein [Nonomuraea basaltis]TMR90756.1 DUF4342 domain-containing protein [Nonomuraea basaltis]